jgi:hypothetical protein
MLMAHRLLEDGWIGEFLRGNLGTRQTDVCLPALRILPPPAVSVVLSPTSLANRPPASANVVGCMLSPLKPRVNAMIVSGLRSIGRDLLAPLLLATPHGKSYRPEIDGLRALAVLAVLAVIANHLNPSLAPTVFSRC